MAKKREKPKFRRTVEVYTKQEVSALVNAIQTRTPIGLRNRALLMLMYRSGLRSQEALDLRPGDLDRAKHKVRVVSGKGMKPRIVGMDELGFEYVERWLDARELLGFKPSQPLFCSRYGKPLCTSYLRKLMTRLGKKALYKLPKESQGKRWHPHGLRHTLASEMLDEGEKIATISAELGHESISTTDRYLRRLEPGDLISAMTSRKADRTLFSAYGNSKKKRKKTKK